MHFVQSKEAYRDGRALVFHNIDYLMMTYKLVTKDYMYLAERLVPMGDQINMTKEEIAAMLRTKTRRFTEADIQKKFKTTTAPIPAATGALRRSSHSTASRLVPGALSLLAMGPIRVDAAKVEQVKLA